MCSSETSKYFGSEYSTEKAKYLKYEKLGNYSKHEKVQNSGRDSFKNKKDDYSMYIDRPFNSIDGKKDSYM